jgi:nucleoid-associated protein YgaU
VNEALVRFDDPPRGDLDAGASATERIASTLKSAGVDAPNSLYDEALGLARDGHLGQAHARLQMLLCLDPDDADAHLLMAKVHAAQNRPAESLARLDAAVAAGGLPPAGFREHLEAEIRAERGREEEHRARIAAREQGEIRSLRNETRTLRSEQVRLETEVTETRVRERNWKYAALGTSLVGTVVLLLLSATTGGAPAAAPVEAAAVEAVAAVAEASPSAPSAPSAPPSALPAVKAPSKPVAIAEAPAKAAQKKGGVEHVVGPGDTLYKLADRYYGDSSRWEDIAKANKSQLRGRIDLSLGMKLRIP